MKRPNRLLAILAAFLLLAGCAAGTPQLNSAPATGQSSVQTDPAQYAGGLHTLMLAANSANLVNGTADAGGFCYIQPNPENILTGTLRRIDYADGQDAPLALSSGGSDPSRLDSLVGEYGVFSWDGELYLLQSGARGYENSDLGDKALGALSRLDPDTGSWALLHQTAAGTLLLGDAAADDQGRLYLLEQTSGAVKLIRLDRQTGQTASLASFGVDARLLGARDTLLYLSCTAPEGGLQILSCDPATGSTQTVLSLPGDGSGTPLVCGDTLYYFPYDQPTVLLYSLSGEQQGSIDLSAALNGKTVYEQIYAVGDFLFLPIYDSGAKAYGTVVFSTRDQSVQTSRITFHDEEKNEDYSALVVAETGDDLLVLTRRSFTDAVMPQGDGTTLSVSLPRYGFSRISRQDYLASRADGLQSIRSDS